MINNCADVDVPGNGSKMECGNNVQEVVVREPWYCHGSGCKQNRERSENGGPVAKLAVARPTQCGKSISFAESPSPRTAAQQIQTDQTECFLRSGRQTFRSDILNCPGEKQ
jgi:hypothetical protein